MDKIDKPPIIYIRGFAGGTAGIDAQVDDPFYGFNKGATHIRTGGDGEPRFYQFEGPLLRLINDEGYHLLVQGDQSRVLLDPNLAIPPASLWVYRFYDQAATTFQAKPHENLAERAVSWIHRRITSDGFDIEEAAAGLYDLIESVLARTGATKVHLVAHSMGGLVARCMMQKICLLPDTRKPKGQQERRPAKDIVARLFTYGTPHGGITSSAGVAQWVEQAFGPAGSNIFAPELMQGYLDKDHSFGDTCDEGWDPQLIDPSVFDRDNIFCIVGTDPTDYGWGPRTVVGPKSDGLVRIEHAYVRGAHRAYVHKSHSGSYGEVNSEEGYQNLRRFLFGKWSVAVTLANMPAWQPDWPSWQADVRLAIRGVSVVMSEQMASHWCPVMLNGEQHRPTSSTDSSGGVTAEGTAAAPKEDSADNPVPLVSTFLLDPADRSEGGAIANDGRMRYTLTLAVNRVVESNGSFFFNDNLEQVPDWTDSLIVDVQPVEGSLQVWTAWNSTVPGANADQARINDALSEKQRQQLTFTQEGSELIAYVALPEVAASIPVFGASTRMKIIVTSRAVGAQRLDGLA